MEKIPVSLPLLLFQPHVHGRVLIHEAYCLHSSKATMHCICMSVGPCGLLLLCICIGLYA